MFGPDDSSPCKGCSFLTDQMPAHLGVLRERNTNYVIVSRAPYDRIAEFQKRMGWPQLWVSSFESDFNFDFKGTVSEQIKPEEWNWHKFAGKGEQSMFNVFVRGDDGGIYHSYAAGGRGTDHMLTTLQLLDLTPMGRQHQPGPPGGMLYHDEIEA